jgi:hypothetical protein
MQFAPVKAGHPMYWERRLSLASCLADATILRIESPLDLDPMFWDLSMALAPSMLIWRDAIDRAPPVIQLRTAYHVGLAAVALMTRARSSLVAPAGMATVDARNRERILRSRLEPLLVPARKVAMAAFSVIDDVAREDPEFESNPVHRAMVRSAREMLDSLEPRETPRPLPQLVQVH